MIKEKNKKSRFEKKKKSIVQTLSEYGRTIGISFLIALVFTLLLSFHARSEMIRNLYTNVKEQQKIDRQIAKQLISQSDLTKDLKKKNYSVIMQVGLLYESAGDLKNAQYAYKLATEKAGQGVYTPFYRLAKVLTAQAKFAESEQVIKSVKDINNKKLIKFKTRAYIEMGDKYYSIGKFLSAAKSYEKSKYYYDKFARQDRFISEAIIDRIAAAYTETADLMVKSGLNSDAVRYLKKAENYRPDDFNLRYKLAIIYSDYDPIQSVKYFEPLMEERPQDIDYGVYSKALMKAANIADWEGHPAQAKYYRYKIHSLDIYVNNKVIYKNDVEIYLDSFSVRKVWFKYRLKGKYRIKNISNTNITNLYADFVLRRRGKHKQLETVNLKCAGRDFPLYSNGGFTREMPVVFGKNIFTRKELEQYVIDIYLYKDKKFKTLINTMSVPLKTIKYDKESGLN